MLVHPASAGRAPGTRHPPFPVCGALSGSTGPAVQAPPWLPARAHPACGLARPRPARGACGQRPHRDPQAGQGPPAGRVREEGGARLEEPPLAEKGLEGDRLEHPPAHPVNVACRRPQPKSDQLQRVSERFRVSGRPSTADAASFSDEAPGSVSRRSHAATQPTCRAGRSVLREAGGAAGSRSPRTAAAGSPHVPQAPPPPRPPS